MTGGGRSGSNIDVVHNYSVVNRRPAVVYTLTIKRKTVSGRRTASTRDPRSSRRDQNAAGIPHAGPGCSGSGCGPLIGWRFVGSAHVAAAGAAAEG